MARDNGMTEETLTPVHLMGDHPAVIMPIVIVSSGTDATMLKGTVLGKVTASGKYTGVAPDAADGSEAAAAILAEEVIVPAAGDVKTNAFFHGSFNRAGLVWTDSEITIGEQDTAVAELVAAKIFVL